MTDRYYAPNLSDIPVGKLVKLSTEESTHAVRVMRVGQGDTVEMFDGKSNVAQGRVITADRREVTVEVFSQTHRENVPAIKVDLWTALPKPDRCKDLVARLTELGVWRLVPIVCRRTQRPPSDAALEKLRRVVVESCKQCRRNQLMTVEVVRPFADALAEDNQRSVRRIAHPNVGEIAASDNPATHPRDVAGDRTDDRVKVLVGPEGGFDDTEYRSAIEAGFHPMDLGSRIYRIETAAVVSATLAIYGGGPFGRGSLPPDDLA